MKEFNFNKLSSARFEELCSDLLDASGFVNIDWRKGTGLNSSPADKGRDIVCDLPRTDPDGSHHFERYFIDCKHYKKGVPPTELQNLLSWATAERPDVAVFAVSNFLSNPSKEFIETYREKNHPPFKIKHWERPQLTKMLSRKISLQRKYKLSETAIRSVKKILAAADELDTRLWYGRKMPPGHYRKQGVPEEIIEGMLKSREKAEERYGKQSLMENMKSDWDWGYLSGKVAAIRWVLGLEWDVLDT
jgi:hypothetical protein